MHTLHTLHTLTAELSHQRTGSADTAHATLFSREVVALAFSESRRELAVWQCDRTVCSGA